jgi:3-hydroxyacyl-[acyl-carrier-protein] dehydratase
MNRDEIKHFLPHREPMLLVDETDTRGDTAYGHYVVRGDEWFLQGHFPGNPVVPGVVLCEMIGQNCAMLLGDKLIGKATLFTGIKQVKFRKSVHPGDTVELEGRIIRQNGPFFVAEGSAFISGQVAAQGQFSFALIAQDETKAT